MRYCRLALVVAGLFWINACTAEFAPKQDEDTRTTGKGSDETSGSEVSTEDDTEDDTDECPEDPDKTTPGVCGCGEPDADGDGDGTLDCLDGCPGDPDKTSSGECGCGRPDVDGDGDGALDCLDSCPKDPEKTKPGECGCGVPDVDGDGDGILDCLDGCPDDPEKTEFGECGCGVPDIDSDGDGVFDCFDECPDDPYKTAPGECGCGAAEMFLDFYPDCDGDGVFAATAVTACDLEDASAMFDCEDGEEPDGGWAGDSGTDCNDENAAAAKVRAFYPDCDGDKVFAADPVDACDEAAADSVFDCADGESPDGGWSSVAGTDCNDEDSSGAAEKGWYPDCDGDGVFASVSVLACGTTGAEEAYDCADGESPDGGWSSVAGADCNDEDASGAVEESWSPDCDGDGVFSAVSTVACGTTGADTALDCADGQNPDGGWSRVAGNDCNDEDDSGAVEESWYPDCDGDGVFSGASTVACGSTGADAAFDCGDGVDPDGGWNTVAGTDCDDEDGTAFAVTDWYPDCDGDGVFHSAATSACGVEKANAAFDCADGQNPDGGWSGAAGTDCNDEDAALAAAIPWYPDCDGDGVFASVAINVCGPGSANAAFDCADGQDPDGGWSRDKGSDCDDEDPVLFVSTDWYPDCDKDGVHASQPVTACGLDSAIAAFDCADGQDPDGGWSDAPGTDCNDEDETGAALTDWYPDCDGDGVFSSASTNACGISGASTAFNCADGQNPDGGWSAAPGTDCNDENGAATASSSWYPDCDGDGVFDGAAKNACDEADADGLYDCADGQDPDGGWSAVAGTDCNDEDVIASALTDWYPDCDGDGVFDAASTNACGVIGANGAYDCADGQNPDGGWSAAPGTDCNDEDATASAASDWHPDCDGDGVFDSLTISACGAIGANALYDCDDGQDPDGGWSSEPGTDCNDEDATASTVSAWYPDCDGDGVFDTAALNACGIIGANATFNCDDGRDPDGGWNSEPGTDCNDEDATSSAKTPWYPDCDGDGVFSSVATNACGVQDANALFDCADARDPDGGWSSTAGTDCNDENGSVSADGNWYPDCDGDGVFASTATLACDEADADVVYDCADGQDPDGGWSGTAGTDCNDENGSVSADSSWYPDCDGDGVFASGARSACEETDADARYNCVDGQNPDGGWSHVAGTDCNDENGSVSADSNWYPDCDGDGVFDSAAMSACDAAGANAAYDCDDGQDPDGGWSSSAGTDCNDEDASGSAPSAWYPDCDGDGVFDSAATNACGTTGADAAFNCLDGQNPDGGWSETQGTDYDDEDSGTHCNPGEQDNDFDFVCEPVSTLMDAIGAESGVVDFELESGTYPLYVDGDRDGGGWVLIGRGRASWAWTESGRGEVNSISVGLGTSAAFSPVYLPTSVVQELLDNTGVDLTEVDIRIKRASKVDGSAYQETQWRSQINTEWTWLLDTTAYPIDYMVYDSVLGAGGTETTYSTSSLATKTFLAENYPYTDHTTTDTSSSMDNHGKTGFSYVAGVEDSSDSGSFIYCDKLSGGCSESIPYAEVYIRQTPFAASCLDILSTDPTAPDGNYLIDPDGEGSNAPIAVTCDMAGGGWTLVYSEDFASGDSSGWTNGAGISTPVDTSSTCAGVYGEMLGGFGILGGGALTTQTFDLLGISHTEAVVSMDYVVIDSWDTEAALVYVDGAERYRQTFVHSGANVCGSQWGDHGPQPVDIQIPHTGASVTVEVRSTLNSNATDESFGVDDVFIWVR